MANETILIIDDEELFSWPLRKGLSKQGYRVRTVKDFCKAEAELRVGLRPILVFADRNIDGVNIDKQMLSRIRSLLPEESLIVVYTRKSDLTQEEELVIRSQGAVRVCDSRSLAGSVDRLISEFQDLRAISRATDNLTRSRKDLVSVVVGAEVGLTLIDKEYGCWFASRAQKEIVGGPCTGGLCWNRFHGHPPQVGPCWGCGVAEVLKNGKPVTRVILSHLSGGKTEWLLVQTNPIRDEEGGLIAASEAVSVYDNAVIENMDPTDRMFAVARGLLHAGFGRIRIYSVTAGSREKRLVAASARTDPYNERPYFESLDGLEFPYDPCPYSQDAVKSKMGLIVRDWGKYGPSPFRERLGLSPPYFTIPIWDDEGNHLMGFLAADFGGWPEDVRAYAIDHLVRKETLAWVRDDYGAEIRKALTRLTAGTSRLSERAFECQMLAEKTRLSIGAAGSVEEATTVLRGAYGELLPDCVITVRVNRDDKLILEPRLSVGPLDSGPSSIAIDAPDSLAAYVFDVYRRPLWINDYSSHVASEVVPPVPRGLCSAGTVSSAHLPLRFEATMYGTLSVDSMKTIQWREEGYAEPLIKLAQHTALVLREMAIHDSLNEANSKNAALVAFSSTIGGDAMWRHWAIQELQSLSAHASILFSVAASIRDGKHTIDAGETANKLAAVARAIDDTVKMLKHKQPIDEDRRSESHLLTELMSPLSSKYQGAGVGFPEEYPVCHVRITKHHFRRMIQFLLDNALEACGQGDTCVRSDVKVEVDVIGKALHLSVIDFGPGIPDEICEEILRGPVPSSGKGMGIGLLIVRGTALQYGGDVVITSLKNPTRFELRLPTK